MAKAQGEREVPRERKDSKQSERIQPKVFVQERLTSVYSSIHVTVYREKCIFFVWSVSAVDTLHAFACLEEETGIG